MRQNDSIEHQHLSDLPRVKGTKEKSCKFIGEKISEDKQEEYGRALDRYFSILDEWAREDES